MDVILNKRDMIDKGENKMESTLENMDMILDNMRGDVASNNASNLAIHADMYRILFNNIQRKSVFSIPDKIEKRKILAIHGEELSDLIQNVQGIIFSLLNIKQAKEASVYVLILDSLEVISKDILSLLARI